MTEKDIIIQDLRRENAELRARVPKWISVKDGLPKNGVHVLLCCEIHGYGGEIAGKYVCDGYYAEANKIIAGDFPDDCDCEYSEEDDEYYLCELQEACPHPCGGACWEQYLKYRHCKNEMEAKGDGS